MSRSTSQEQTLVIGIGSRHGADAIGWLTDLALRRLGLKHLTVEVTSPDDILDRLVYTSRPVICDGCQLVGRLLLGLCGSIISRRVSNQFAAKNGGATADQGISSSDGLSSSGRDERLNTLSKRPIVSPVQELPYFTIHAMLRIVGTPLQRGRAVRSVCRWDRNHRLACPSLQFHKPAH
jgi:hypothetical protein